MCLQHPRRSSTRKRPYDRTKSHGHGLRTRASNSSQSPTSSSSVTSSPSVSTSSSSTSSWSILSSVPTMPLSSPATSRSLSPLESGVRETIEKITEITQLLDVELKASRQEWDKAKAELKRCREAANSRAAEVSALESFRDSTTLQGYSGAVPVNYLAYTRFYLGVSKAPPYTAETLSALIAGEVVHLLLYHCPVCGAGVWERPKELRPLTQIMEALTGVLGAPAQATEVGSMDGDIWAGVFPSGYRSLSTFGSDRRRHTRNAIDYRLIAIYVQPRVIVSCSSHEVARLQVPHPRLNTANVKFVQACPQSDTNACISVVCKPTSLLDPVSISMNLLFKDSMKAGVIVTTVIAAAPILAGVATWRLGRHGDDRIGYAQIEYAQIEYAQIEYARIEYAWHRKYGRQVYSAQVPQLRSDLHGGAVDIVAVTVDDPPQGQLQNDYSTLSIKAYFS
ncbi:hypothetical protein EDD15DRAFT_2196246 [Pisolithus albus]|nr:hypothetical protein EDD15DRAFT_2196246 [Pisolithus albus]